MKPPIRCSSSARARQTRPGSTPHASRQLAGQCGLSLVYARPTAVADWLRGRSKASRSIAPLSSPALLPHVPRPGQRVGRLQPLWCDEPCEGARLRVDGHTWPSSSRCGFGYSRCREARRPHASWESSLSGFLAVRPVGTEGEVIVVTLRAGLATSAIGSRPSGLFANRSREDPSGDRRHAPLERSSCREEARLHCVCKLREAASTRGKWAPSLTRH